MLFQLPENLKKAIAVYDPALKPLIEAEKATQKQGKPRKPSNHLGLPVGFIPAEILSLKSQEEIFTEFNQSPASDRYKMVEDSKRVVLVYHHQKVWQAYWFLKDKSSLLDQPYVYGFAIAYKTAPSTANSISAIQDGGHVINRSFNDTAQIQEFNKKEYYYRIEYYSVEMIRDGMNSCPWKLNLNQGKDTFRKRESARLFTNLIRCYLPNWGIASHVFERISNSNKSVLACAADRIYSMDHVSGDMTVDQLTNHFCSFTFDVEHSESFRSILEKPFFRKDMHAVAQQCNAAYHDYSINEIKELKGPFLALQRKMKGLDAFFRIYPDSTLDHMQRVYTASQYLNEFCPSSPVANWINKNVPVSSFVGWIEAFIEQRQQQWIDTQARSNYTFPEDTMPSVRFNMLCDTFNMLRDIYEHQNKKNPGQDGIDFTYARRWRLIELHDALSGELWKYRTSNNKLPQDLIPRPIKIQQGEDQWTFFQPRDVHQLGDWGRAVRNCVGSASSYYKGIKDKRHFIVLAMINNRPEFTIQLTLAGDNISVNQIAGVANANLTSTQAALYQEAFSRVLQIRSEQLQPVE